MIYTSAIYANADHTQVTGTDSLGNTETVPADHTIFRCPDDGPIGFVNNGGVIGPYVAPEPEPVKQMLGPISAATLTISGGEVLGVETSVNFAMAFMIDVDTYWVLFTEPEPDTNYLVLGNAPFVRYTDFIEITAPDQFEVAITTWRVS
jgi:hypothetical protein